MTSIKRILTVRINPLVTGVLILIVAVTSMALFAREMQDGQDDKTKASPRSSHDSPTRPIAPHHSKPVKEEDGKTLLWAGGDSEGGEGAIWFDMTDALVNPREFQFGIGKDRIPSIDNPKFIPYRELSSVDTRVTDQTDVIGYVAEGIAKAYPLFIMDRHEIVNDTFAGTPYAVYW